MKYICIHFVPFFNIKSGEIIYDVNFVKIYNKTHVHFKKLKNGSWFAMRLSTFYNNFKKLEEYHLEFDL